MARDNTFAQLSSKVRIALLLFAVFTVFINWRAKALEKRTLHEGEENRLMGKAAPPFSLTALDGGTVSLADYHGKKKLVVSFWASWCSPCRMELSVLQSLYKKSHKASSEFEIVAISTDDEKGPAEEFATQEKISFPILLDSRHEAADAYEVTAIPYLLVVDPDGKVIYEQHGFNPALEVLLKEKLGLRAEGAREQAGDGQPGH